MAHALVRPASTRPFLARSFVSRDEKGCASFGVSRDRRPRLPSRALLTRTWTHSHPTQALEWTYGFSSALPDSVVNLSTPSSPTRRLAYVAAHTLVVHESDARDARESSARQFALRGHRSAIRSVCASDDRAVLVTAEAGPDAAIVFWDVEHSRPSRTIEGQHPGGVAAADLTPCGRWFATLESPARAEAPFSQTVRVWDLRDTRSDAPAFVGVAPEALRGDEQTCIKFNPAAPRELVTNGKTGVAFFLPDDAATAADATDADAGADDPTDAASVSSNAATTDADAHSEKSEKTPTRRKRARLRAYAPPARAGHLRRRVAPFTVSAFATARNGAVSGAARSEGAGSCVTGTADGDLVVWMSGGLWMSEARGMRTGDRRGVKIVRAHARGAVTYLGVSPRGAAASGAFVVTGGSDGNVRFFDEDLRLVAWFDGLDAGSVTSVSFEKTARDGRPALASSETRELREETRETKAFAAPDFVVATRRAFVFALRSADFETLGSAEAVARASLVTRGAMEPAVALAAHPAEPVLCVVGADGGVWTWNVAARAVARFVDLTRGGAKPHSKPTCVAYRSDGSGILVGTRDGALKALDPQTLAETQTMRFTRHAVTRVRCGDGPARSSAAAADEAGGVSLFRLLGPIHESEGGANPARAFDFIGTHRTHAEETPCVGLAFVPSSNGESVELVSVGAEGRVARIDVGGSAAEAGVDVIEVSDVALGGEAAGGDARPTAAACVARVRTRVASERSSRRSGSDSASDASGSEADSAAEAAPPPPATLLVADDHLKLRTVDCETLTCVGVKCAPPCGDAPVAFLAPFGDEQDRFAFARARDVAGVGRLPADGDPSESAGVVAHPGKILALAVSEAVVDDDDGTRVAATRVFTLGGGGVGVGDRDDRGSVVSTWRVDAAAARRRGGGTTGTPPTTRVSRVSKRNVAARRVARLLEGGASGALAEAAHDAFAFARIRARGEDATRNRAADARPGTVPVSDAANLLRALGLYLTEREANDVAAELRYEAELAGEAVPETVDFDRFLSLYVDRRPPRDVGVEDVRDAFEVALDGEGDAVSRESLLETLKTSGETMSDEELAAAAKALAGRDASIEDLFPEKITAKSFVEDVLGFPPVEER